MPAPKEVLDLIERFQHNRETYENPHFNETETRIRFLNPLFKALGWDVDNTAGNAEAYKDVIHEDAVKVGGATKAPDYCFTIGGARKFFLEAKKPAVNVKDDANPAYQLRRYAWSAKLPVSVLSNFAELAVYDCRARPDKDDKASKGRIQYWECEQYAEKWDEIASIFSKDAILKGSFDKFATTSRNKRGTAEVDDEFLNEIEEWRDLLLRTALV
jgi:predicted type IV restriction endonuclease